MKAVFTFIILTAVFFAGSFTQPACAVSPADNPEDWVRFVNRNSIDCITELDVLGLSDVNKPNGRIYRLRETPYSHLPKFIETEMDGLTLSIADFTENGWFCFYRGPFSTTNDNSQYKAVFYKSKRGKKIWAFSLNRHLSEKKFLEVQDIRYSDGLLYFNEACQSYAQEASGFCSALVCMDPEKQEIKWRTPWLVSNNIFIFHGDYIICGYGFTGEPDHLFVLDKKTGEILWKTKLDSAHDYLEIKGNQLFVTTYKSMYTFDISNLNSNIVTKPKPEKTE